MAENNQEAFNQYFSDSAVLDIQDAYIYQDEQPVLENLNFSIEKGEFVYLVGRTGSGKSSLLKILYGDLPLKLGNIYVAGFNMKQLKRKHIPKLRRKLGIVFQDFQLFFDRTVAENLYFVMRATGWKDKTKMKKRFTEVLMRVGLGAVGTKFPHQLSGGEQQRVVIARALINEPLLLIADEPTGNLDPQVSKDIFKLFQNINNSGTTVLMATHNHQFIETFPARILKCDNGMIRDSREEAFSLSDSY